MPLDHKIVTLLIHYLYKNVGILNIRHFLIRNPDKHAKEVSFGFLKKPSKTLTVAPTSKTTSAIKAYPLIACLFQCTYYGHRPTIPPTLSLSQCIQGRTFDHNNLPILKFPQPFFFFNFFAKYTSNVSYAHANQKEWLQRAIRPLLLSSSNVFNVLILSTINNEEMLSLSIVSSQHNW